MAKVKSTSALIKELEAKAKQKAENRKLKTLSTEKGINRHFRKQDTKVLANIIAEIEDITNKPVFGGFIYSTNVETIVSICSALQYMKGELRDQISDGIWAVFDKDIRTDVLDAYGRLPYLADPVLVEIDGEIINIDPEAADRAETGIVGDPAELEALVNEIGLDLGLMSEMSCSQKELDKAWVQATSKIKKSKLMEQYKDSLAA